MQAAEINPLTLPPVPLAERRRLPNCSAVYFAIAGDGEILYVGRTSNLTARWFQHHRYVQLKDIDGVRLAWLECPTELLNEVELALIAWFKPELNGSLIPAEPSAATINPRMERLSATMPREVLQGLRELCRRERRPLSAQLTLIVEEYLKEQHEPSPG